MVHNLAGHNIGRYLILEKLDDGGMATVYKALDTTLDREVAVKILKSERLSSEKAIKRFEIEAKATAKLKQDNIVRVLDYGEYQTYPYLVMELVEGGTLKDKLGHPFPPQEAAKILVPIAEALAYAHEHQIIHRDVKPSNILITKNGRPMLADFGVAKILTLEETLDLTEASVGVGTPWYMAPEQGKIDFRSDIYSLGVVLYELITGRKPYQAETPLAVLLKHIQDPLPSPREYVKDLPKKVERIILKALMKDPQHRYQNMEEFAEALNSISTIPVSPKSPNKVWYLIAGLGLLIVAGGVYLSIQGLFGTRAIDPAQEYSDTLRIKTRNENKSLDQPSIEFKTPESYLDEDGDKYSPTLDSLNNAIVPINDPIDIAQRLEGKEDIPLTLPVKDLDLPVGAEQIFWVNNSDTGKNFQLKTTLAAVTDHLYLWIENGVEYSQSEVNHLADDFEKNIYPKTREFFGSEWYPGIDEDPHIYVIYARDIGSNIAGYYNSRDEYHPALFEFSNAHETIYVSADNASLGDDYTFGVLAHELQYMIHWYRDRNETDWLNTGFSELAILLTGHKKGPTHDYYFADDPDIQLNDWPNDSYTTIPHYGNTFLFVTYFMDRFGSDVTRALVADELNGLASIDNTLREFEITDPDTGKTLTADDVFLDWVVTNFLKDEYNISDRFTYISYPDAPYFYATEEIHECSTGELQREVNQYAADYIEVNCSESFSINFTGQQSVQLLPEDPYSGDHAFWSNKGNKSDMRLTREFDLRNISGPINFSYNLWYDLEDSFDYVFLEISTNGEEWQIIRTPSSTQTNLFSTNYSWGYSGLSGGNGTWIEETVDLSEYAGELIQLRFEYITEASFNGEGLLLDSVSIPEIDYYSDFESDDGGWIAEGFVRIENSLPQTYRLALIHMDDVPKVEFITVQSGEKIEIPVEADASKSGRVVLVVTGTTRFTRQKALYWLELEQD